MHGRTLGRGSAAFILAALGVLAALVPIRVQAAPSAAAWTSNGATACQKFLPPAIAAAIMTKPGVYKTLSPQSCSYGSDAGSITITLKAVSPQSFAAFEKYLIDPRPLAGVGDKAF